ncbi:PREDICTED: WAT1-related protein At3g18200-like isoform X2 [Nelumbo nucifera]|uniref:WAT1-related protein n=1 Tax=Nelumbo nucifera TaxID=4432 RepID=A0A1U8QB62_NELNU|nr:PREDICTED: WAT1-related protein At3g18200-like isoform X2 [Nelumbo nucifera]
MKLLLGLLTLQLCIAGLHIVSRLALDMGVSKIVYTVYRNVIAVILLGPFAYFLEKVTANQGFYLLGLYYASPTFTSAMQNSVPAITFALASALRYLEVLIRNSSQVITKIGSACHLSLSLSLRLEPVNFLRRDGLAKVVGTILCVGGATIITLYKGPPLFHLNDLPPGNTVVRSIFLHITEVKNWTLGCLYLIGHCLSWSAWILLQASVVRKYPAKLSITTFTCLFGLLQFLVIANFAETDSEHWKIHSVQELLIILYAGVVATGIVYALQMWCIDKGRPVFVAVFQPVSTVIVAVLACLILSDQLYTGGIIGVILIIIGLYSVLWGRNEERKFRERKEEALTRHLLCEKNTVCQESAVVSDIP